MTHTQLSALLKNQSFPALSDSGVITPLTKCRMLKNLKIKPKNIPVAMSWEIAPMMNIFLVDICLCRIQSGISIQKETKFAKPRKTPTRATLWRRNVKKNTTEK